jgi:hypothetical protein
VHDGRFDLAAMTRDTRVSLEECPRAIQELRSLLRATERRRLDEQQRQIRASLRPEHAYLDLPNRPPAE